MEFFEFFFSGPEWGWKVFALICFTDIFFSGVVGVIKAVFEGKTKKILAEIKSLTADEKSKEDTKATKDDFR